MNYLAHIYLSGDSDDILLGNFIGDSVKGSDLSAYSAGVQQGIVLHRAIDTFTDTHPEALRSIVRLRPSLRKYAGVVTDIFYDHILAKNWSRYDSRSLRTFVDQAYQRLEARKDEMPYKSARFLHYLLKYDMLFEYSSHSGIDQVLKGMAYRTKFESGMEDAARLLPLYLKDLEADFYQFFPELKAFVNQQIQGT